MNFEEQKPTDLLDFVKEESHDETVPSNGEDFLEQEIKSEPLEEECFMKNVPKLEEVSDFEDSSGETSSKRIKLEDDVIKEEPLDNDCQHTNVFRNPEKEHFDMAQFAPRIDIEPRIDVCHVFARGHLQKPIHQEQEMIKIIKITRNSSRKNSSKRNSDWKDQQEKAEYCAVCLTKKLAKDLKNGIMNDEKLVIMIGQVLKRKKTTVNAKWFLMGTREVSTCLEHIREAKEAICCYLNIKNLEEVMDSSQNLMEDLSTIVSNFAPSISIPFLREVIFNFAKIADQEQTHFIEHSLLGFDSQDLTPYQTSYTNESILSQSLLPQYERSAIRDRSRGNAVKPCIATSSTNPPEPIDAKPIFCEICSTEVEEFIAANMREHKEIIIIGCVLNGYFSIETGKLIAALRKTSFHICSYHILDTIHCFLKILEIENLQELSINCPWEKILPTVQEFRKNISSTQQILNVFREFTSSTRHFHWMPVQKKSSCALCGRLSFMENQVFQLTDDQKMMITIGKAIKGKVALRQTKVFLSAKRQTPICHDHFCEAVNEICKFLHIKKLEEYVECRQDLMENLMTIVSKLTPSITISKLGEFFESFDRNDIREVLPICNEDS